MKVRSSTYTDECLSVFTHIDGNMKSYWPCLKPMLVHPIADIVFKLCNILWLYLKQVRHDGKYVTSWVRMTFWISFFYPLDMLHSSEAFKAISFLGWPLIYNILPLLSERCASSTNLFGPWVWVSLAGCHIMCPLFRFCVLFWIWFRCLLTMALFNKKKLGRFSSVERNVSWCLLSLVLNW